MTKSILRRNPSSIWALICKQTNLAFAFAFKLKIKLLGLSDPQLHVEIKFYTVMKEKEQKEKEAKLPLFRKGRGKTRIKTGSEECLSKSQMVRGPMTQGPRCEQLSRGLSEWTPVTIIEIIVGFSLVVFSNTVVSSENCQRYTLTSTSYSRRESYPREHFPKVKKETSKIFK